MDRFIKVDNRYLPLHTVVYVDDDGERLLIAVRDAKTGPTEYRLSGDAAGQLRSWLSEHVAVAVESQNEPQDVGYRGDD